jgi:hypothetical protein
MDEVGDRLTSSTRAHSGARYVGPVITRFYEINRGLKPYTTVPLCISDPCVYRRYPIRMANVLKLQSYDARFRPAFRQSLTAGPPSAANLFQKSPSPNLRGTEGQRIKSRGSFRIG